MSTASATGEDSPPPLEEDTDDGLDFLTLSQSADSSQSQSDENNGNFKRYKH